MIIRSITDYFLKLKATILMRKTKTNNDADYFIDFFPKIKKIHSYIKSS